VGERFASSKSEVGVLCEMQIARRVLPTSERAKNSLREKVETEMEGDS
jgi:hypothetical protein